MRILIVDDDEVALEALAHVITQAGHEPVYARSGSEALSSLRQDPCHMVISDWEMPEINGVELCRRIRQDGADGYVYLVLVTARSTSEDIVEGMSAGADDFIVKPFHPDELRVRIRAGERVLALETRDVAIFAMAKLAESRDPETGAHLERMRNFSQVLAQHMASSARFGGLVDEEYVRLIYLTSPLHDIGKVGIPDSVLLKPGRLSDREFEIMKTHTIIGAETLGAAMHQYPGVVYLHMARDIALAHHERFDGSGYPVGSVGQDIPLCARIVALADVYDALTSKRVYKAAFHHDVARSMICEETGRHFDPDVVDAFVEHEKEFLDIRRRFAEPEMVSV
jgi:putative two-component system response regulator